MPGMQLRGGPDSLLALHHVRTTATRHVQVDEAWNNIRRAVGHLITGNCRNMAIELDPAIDPPVGRQDMSQAL